MVYFIEPLSFIFILLSPYAFIKKPIKPLFNKIRARDGDALLIGEWASVLGRCLQEKVIYLNV